MTIESRVERLEDGIEELRRLNRAVVQLLGQQEKRLDTAERQAHHAQRIWVAVAKKLELWDELEEDGLA